VKKTETPPLTCPDHPLGGIVIRSVDDVVCSSCGVSLALPEAEPEEYLEPVSRTHAPPTGPFDQLTKDALQFRQQKWITAFGLSRAAERSAKGDVKFVPPEPEEIIRDGVPYAVFDERYALALEQAGRAHTAVWASTQDAITETAKAATTMSEKPDVADGRDFVRQETSPQTLTTRARLHEVALQIGKDLDSALPYLRQRGPKNDIKRQAVDDFVEIVQAFDAKYPGASHVDIAIACGLDESTVRRRRSS
jgi:hypothetical protein